MERPYEVSQASFQSSSRTVAIVDCMAAAENFFDRAVLAFVSRISGGVAAAVAVVIWGTGMALPVALHWRVWFVVEANAIGTVFAGVVIIGWLLVRIQQAQRRNLLEWTSNLRLLNAEEFEWLVSAKPSDGRAGRFERPAARTLPMATSTWT